MDFGQAIGTACASFAATNLDDIFVLVTFFAESSTSKVLTPLRITIGQYAGFTLIVVVSMIGYGASFLFAAEPIGFLGLLPCLLGVWGILALLFREAGDDAIDNDSADQTDDQQTTSKPSGLFSGPGIKAVLKVASITVMNGADNVGVYVPLFSQARGAEIAVYVVVYYVLLGVWVLAAWLFMKQRHVLAVAQKYARVVVPFLYVGLGIFIMVNSECYPWSIEEIDRDLPATEPGTGIMAGVTSAVLLAAIGIMVVVKLRKKKSAQCKRDETQGEDGISDPVTSESQDGSAARPGALEELVAGSKDVRPGSVGGDTNRLQSKRFQGEAAAEIQSIQPNK